MVLEISQETLASAARWWTTTLWRAEAPKKEPRSGERRYGFVMSYHFEVGVAKPKRFQPATKTLRLLGTDQAKNIEMRQQRGYSVLTNSKVASRNRLNPTSRCVPMDFQHF